MSTLEDRVALLIAQIGPDVKLLLSRETFLTYSISGVQATDVGKLEMPVLAGTYTIMGVTARLNTAPTGATTFKVDVNKNGTTIFTDQSKRPIFAASAKIANSATPDVTSVTTGDYLTVDVDAVGSTVAGSDLTVTVRLKKTA